MTVPWRRVVAGAGRAAIVGGVLLLLFTAYDLWGTGISEASSQRALAHQYQSERARALNAASPIPSPGAAGASGASATGTSAAAVPAAPVPGYAIGVITIPRIHAQKYLVEGTGEAELKEGPGHYPGTPLPGQPGNVAIAGHRTTYGAPFYNLDQLSAGDAVVVQTVDGRSYEYDVTGSRVVAPSDVSVIGPEPGYHLTLTTCTPKYSAADRLIVFASLHGSPTPVPSSAAFRPPGGPGGPGAGSAAASGTPDAPASSSSAAEPASTDVIGTAQNLTAGSSDVPALVGWAAAVVAVWIAIGAVARRRRRSWPAYLVGSPVVLLPLYFLFENIVRLLPPSV